MPVGAVENVPRQHSGKQHARGRDGRQLSLGKAQLHHRRNAPFAQVSVTGFTFRSWGGVFSYFAYHRYKREGRGMAGAGG